jgi:cysteine desulfurase
MCISDELAHTGIRFSLSRFSTAEEIERASAVLLQSVQRLRTISSTYKTNK